MESETLIVVNSTCRTATTGPSEQKLVEPAVTSKKVTSTTAVSSTDDTEQSSHRPRPNLDGVADDDKHNYYIHPNAGYVPRTNNSIVNYKCQWQNYHGSIVAGSKAIVFQGSFFLFDKTFVLSWDNIRQVVLIDPATSSSGLNSGRSNSRNSNNNNNNNSGIEIIMSDETVHSFMMNQQQQNFGTTATTTTKVWLSLLSLHNDALLGRQQADGQTKTVTTSGNQAGDIVDGKATAVTTPRSYERRNSDPVKSSTLIMNPEAFLEDDDPDGASSPPVPCTTATILSTTTEQIPIDIIMVHAGSPLRLQPIHCTYAAGGSQSSNNDSGGIESTVLLSVTDGRLYIGNDAIIFIGTKKPQKRHYFASTWEHLIVTLPWTTILRIQQQKLDVDSCSNNTPSQIGIRIRTHSDTTIDSAAVEENLYDFTGIEAPEQVWASLVAIHNEKLLQLSSIVAMSPKQMPPVGVSILSGSKTTAGHREVGSLSNRRKSHRRTNSDPVMASIQLNFETYQVLQDENKDDDNREMQSSNEETSTSATTGMDMKQPNITTDGRSHSDLWLSMKNQSTTKEYTDIVVENEIIENCTLEQFYDTFMTNDAIYSMERFLTGRGDFDVRTSDWEEDINAAGSEEPSNVGAWTKYKRVIKYMHPVNVPLAPPQAAARKEQLLTRYHNAGICIVTQTFVDDVPMTDCFYVADRMLVEPSSSIEGALTIRMEFGITFVKSTMFKGIISRKTTAEFVELFKALAQFISNAMISSSIAPLTQDIDMTTGSTIPIKEEVESNLMKFQASDEMNKNTSKAFLSIDRMILLLLIIIQFWIIMELKGMKHAIVSLEQQIRNRDFVDQPNMINSGESFVGR